jgi:hypothetical protein
MYGRGLEAAAGRVDGVIMGGGGVIMDLDRRLAAG